MQVDLSQLMVFQGRYEQNFTGLGPGYLSSDNMYLMIIQNRTRTVTIIVIKRDTQGLLITVTKITGSCVRIYNTIMILGKKVHKT